MLVEMIPNLGKIRIQVKVSPTTSSTTQSDKHCQNGDLDLTLISKAIRASCKKALKKQEQSTSIVDPLAYVATPICTIANLLSGFPKEFPPTNTSSGLLPTPKLMYGADGSICKEQEKMDSQLLKDKALLMELYEEKGDVLMLKLKHSSMMWNAPHLYDHTSWH
ncbi:hypothetical protein Tco_1577740 [Tanacetum coccineum]